MAYDLDAPTVFRVGHPTLGVPIFSLDYRAAALVPAPPDPMARLAVHLLDLDLKLVRLDVRIAQLERRLAQLQLELPWWRRLWRWVRHGLRKCLGR